MFPKLSIITINLNNKEGLLKTIESVVKQTYTNFEYIIIDGNSSDGSIDCLKQYSDKITFYVSEPDSGIYNAMNKGIIKATGEYCLFLNSGDYFVCSEILSQIVSLNFSEDFVYGDMKFHNDSGKELISCFPDKLNIQFFYNSSICHQATLIKRELFIKYGKYNENNNLISDWEFLFLRIILDKCTYRKINLIITYYDMYNGLSVKFDKERIKEQKKIFEENIPDFTKDLLVDYLSINDELKTIKKSIFYKFYRKFTKLKKFINVNI
jgi:glycosyltransferase involved in cell wall biosynthesis